MTRPSLQIAPEMGFYQIGESWSFAVKLFDELGQENPASAATITILHAGGTAVVEGGTMATAGPTISYSMDAGLITAPERSMQVRMTVTVNEETFVIPHVFDAVRFAPRCPITKADLAVEIANLKSVASPADPECMGAMTEAWRDVLRFLKGIAVYPDLVLDATELRAGCLYRACELIYGRDAKGAPQSMSVWQCERYGRQWKDWTKATLNSIDADNSGTIEKDERQRSASIGRFGRSEA